MQSEWLPWCLVVLQYLPLGARYLIKELHFLLVFVFLLPSLIGLNF